MKNLKLAALNGSPRTTVKVRDVEFGRGFVIIAGPCAVENDWQPILKIHETWVV